MKGKTIGLFLVLMGLLMLGIVGFLSGSPSSAPDTTARWTGITAPLPLEQAAQKGQERASAWQPDAVLVRVEASWRPSERWLEIRTLPVMWVFTYYSPSGKAIATVSVGAEKMHWVPPMEVVRPPRALSAFPPPYGVDQMWLTFLGAGGEEFVRQHPDALVHILLQMEETGPIWQVSAVGEEGSIKVRINAETGVVIP